MEQRFRFKMPTEGELKLSEQGKLLLPLGAVAVIALNVFPWPSAFLKFGFGLVVSLVVVWLLVRLGGIQRREAQGKYGFVELTPYELRVSISERSLLRIDWPDLKAVDVKNGWLHFQYLHAQLEQGGQTKRLDRVKIADLENPDGLLHALQLRTNAPLKVA